MNTPPVEQSPRVVKMKAVRVIFARKRDYDPLPVSSALPHCVMDTLALTKQYVLHCGDHSQCTRSEIRNQKSQSSRRMSGRLIDLLPIGMLDSLGQTYNPCCRNPALPACARSSIAHLQRCSSPIRTRIFVNVS